MVTKHLLTASTAAALTAMLASAASSQTTAGTLKAPPPKVSFLTPLPSRFVLRPVDPDYPREVCREQAGRRCPPVLAYGGVAGGLPTIEPAVQSYLPHVRVTFALEDVFNEVVEAPGIDPQHGSMALRWETTSSAADVEVQAGWLNLYNPSPDTNWTLLKPSVIYDALVFDACDSFPTFPIDHTAFFERLDFPYGSFHGVDNSTIDTTGFYHFKYSVPAELYDSVDGEVASIFHLSGKVSVTCTAINSL